MRRPPRLVLDTNVVISAVLWGGMPGEALDAAVAIRSVSAVLMALA